MNLSDINNVNIVQWCNSCNAAEAIHIVEADLNGEVMNLNICYECFKQIKQRGWL